MYQSGRVVDFELIIIHSLQGGNLACQSQTHPLHIWYTSS